MAGNTRDNDQLRKLEERKGEQTDAANQPVEDVTSEPAALPNDKANEQQQGGQ